MPLVAVSSSKPFSTGRRQQRAEPLSMIFHIFSLQRFSKISFSLLYLSLSLSKLSHFLPTSFSICFLNAQKPLSFPSIFYIVEIIAFLDPPNYRFFRSVQRKLLRKFALLFPFLSTFSVFAPILLAEVSLFFCFCLLRLFSARPGFSFFDLVQNIGCFIPKFR